MATEPTCTCSGDPRYYDPSCPVHGDPSRPMPRVAELEAQLAEVTEQRNRARAESTAEALGAQIAREDRDSERERAERAEAESARLRDGLKEVAEAPEGLGYPVDAYARKARTVLEAQPTGEKP